MAEVRVGKNESLDTALKRFKRSCAKDGVIAEVRKREHYEKPSVKRKKSLRQLVNANINLHKGNCNCLMIKRQKSGRKLAFSFIRFSFL